ncbi:MAG: hypothetical protein EOO77_03210 [Oxalobacteraceae bacterium]|nr:MAG: hypothetical protein EOO77_03210 [Oxalobacteraceae bacterium]
MKEDEIALRIEAFDAANGGGVGWYEDKGPYHLYLLETEAPMHVSSPSARVTKSGSATGHIVGNGKISMTWADASCPSIKPSTTSQTTASSGPGPDKKRTKPS